MTSRAQSLSHPRGMGGPPVSPFRRTPMTCQSQRNMKVPRQNLVPRMCSAARDSSVLSGHCPMAKHG